MREMFLFGERARYWPGGFAIGALVVALAGCQKQNDVVPVRTGPGPTATAAYGPASGVAAKEPPRLSPLSTNDAAWTNAGFFVLQTELSPAALVHSTGRHLNLFSDLKSCGLGAPSFLAWSTKDGPRSFARGTTLDVTRMEENWILVWFAGATGWTNWDSPWAVFLQHKPTSMRLDDAGLHVSFPETAGDVVMMPLFGYYKPPVQGHDFLTEHGLPGKKIKTWEWGQALPRETLTRLRFWAGATRDLPIYCEDSFSVDRSKDAVTIRSRFDYYSIRDEWNTKPIRLAPLSPPLGLTVKLGGFPVQLSKKPFDFELATPYGPYLAVQDTDTFDATFSVLQYVNETEAPAAITNVHPVVQAALEKLHQTARSEFETAERFNSELGGLEGQRRIQAAGWYAKALPYYDTTKRPHALARLRKDFDDLLATNRFQFSESPKASGSGLGDTGSLNANLLETLWACAHFTGDWQLIKERWPLAKALFRPRTETRWAGFGRDAGAGIGDEVAASLAFARMAYKVGDMDSYDYACSLFARELVLLFLKQRGADYFRKEQPRHSMEFMDDEVFLTGLSSEAGWHIDGPKYPPMAGVRQFTNRWARFNNADVGRFHREFLKDDVRREMNWLQPRSEPDRRWHHDPGNLPSFVQLRSLLLNESPAELARVATPEQFTGPPAGIIASCVAVLRASQPTRYERLIPGGEPGPFITGLQRDIAGPNPNLLFTVQSGITNRNAKTIAAGWPQLTWSAWKTPTGTPWSFGQMKPVRANEPRNVRVIPLNWNSQVITFEQP